MTTNEAIALARDALLKLGYKPEVVGCDGPPRWFTGPYDTKDGHHVPHCQVRWERYPEPKSAEEQANNDFVTVEINLDKKTFTGLSIASRKIWRDAPKVDVRPELEKDYQKSTKLGSMFIRTNAPAPAPK